MSRPAGYLGCVDGKIEILGLTVPITLDLYGHRVEVQPEACTVIDAVKLEGNDVTVQLPSEALEVLTTHVNALPVTP